MRDCSPSWLNTLLIHSSNIYCVPIRCQESGIYYLMNFPKQPCQLVIMVPILQMKKPKQEQLSDWSRVTRLLSSRSRTHTPGYLSLELRLFGVDYPASLLPLDSLSSCVSLGKCLCLADKRVLIGKKGTLPCPQHKLGGSN